MFSLHLTNSILSVQLSGLLPGLSIVIHVEKLAEPAPLKVDVKIVQQVPK